MIQSRTGSLNISKGENKQLREWGSVSIHLCLKGGKKEKEKRTEQKTLRDDPDSLIPIAAVIHVNSHIFLR